MTAPIVEAQIIETLVLNVIHLETMLASKAARMMQAACGKGLIDFGMRRTHGIDASVKAARTSYLTGFARDKQFACRKNFRYPGIRHHGALLRHQFST